MSEAGTRVSLAELCALYHYTLVIDPEPQQRADALGDSTQDRLQKAQLCEGRVIAVQEDCPDAAYCVSHELAHGLIGFCDEKHVMVEQANILARWVRYLLTTKPGSFARSPKLPP